MHEGAALKSLRDRPFELLAELERRGRAVTASAAADAEKVGEWVGVALAYGRGALSGGTRRSARGAGGAGTAHARTGSQELDSWLANVRGQLLPIIDLRAYLGSGPTPNARASRVIVVNHRDIPAGLVVDEVLGFRRFADAEFTADVPPTIVRCERYIAGSFRRGSEQWPVLGLRALVEDPAFSEASS
jgi:twitching motility protein PilI